MARSYLVFLAAAVAQSVEQRIRNVARYSKKQIKQSTRYAHFRVCVLLCGTHVAQSPA